MSADTNSVFGSDDPPSFTYNQNHAESYSSNQYRASRIQINQFHPSNAYYQKKESPPQRPLASSSSITAQHPSMSSAMDSSYLVVNSTTDGIFGDTQNRMRHAVADQISPLRLAGHLSVLVVAAVIFVFTQMDLSALDITSLESISADSELGGATLSASNTVDQLFDSSLSAADAVSASPVSLLRRAVMPFTNILPDAPAVGVAAAPTEIRTYIVQPGDTVLGIAHKYDLKPETLQWANSDIEKNPDLLTIGKKLRILPIDGAIHRVNRGDTLSKIASSYNVTLETIMGYVPNNINNPSSPISVGQELVIPGGVKAYVPPQSLSYTEVASNEATVGLGEFNWPTLGRVTQGFWSGHRALDIGAYAGAGVKAADSGRVVIAKSGWNYGYGNYVVVDHGNGFVSLYGHLNSIYVQAGENIFAGQQLGTVGNTGNSTGPHLHFEIRYRDALRNPFTYLD